MRMTNMATSILDSSKITSMANNNNNNNNKGMVLIWSRYDYNHDLESTNNKDITQIIIEPDTIGKQFFSGRNLENIINNLQYDTLAISCFVSRSLDKIIIYKNKNKEENLTE